MSYNTELQENIADLRDILDKVNNLPDAGEGSPAEPILQDKTVTPSTEEQRVTADTGYDGLETVTVEAMPVATQATPSISIDANGKITASATQTEGYVAAGTKSATKQLTTQAAKTVTPTKSSQTAVAKNVYTTGAITVAAIPDKYQDVSEVTATASDVLTGKKIVNSSGTVVSGSIPNNGSISSTMDGLYTKSVVVPAGYTSGGTVRLDNTIDNKVDEQANLIAQISSALIGKAAGGGSSGSATIISAPLAYTEEMGFEPGMSNYVLTSDELQSSTRSLIVVMTNSDAGYSTAWKVFFRTSLSDSFEVHNGTSEYCTHGMAHHVEDNTITIDGATIQSGFDSFWFIAV